MNIVVKAVKKKQTQKPLHDRRRRNQTKYHNAVAVGTNRCRRKQNGVAIIQLMKYKTMKSNDVTNKSTSFHMLLYNLHLHRFPPWR
mmetsp:Transcript_22999/g.54362  ORF Transcript_22999/g.54362 Transcript_22999/m.54362 type:complete len:86 (+) Transcript_22999:1-258(+)